MAMNNITTNVTSVERPSQTTAVSGKVTGGTGYSPFQPQTYVNIENSIRNMLEMLTKTGVEQSAATQEIPEELQKMISEMLQNAFSVDKSLAQGVGNMLQGQKVSIDQLVLLAKMLEQLGIEMEGQNAANLPDAIKALLENVRQLADGDGKNLNAVQLNKLALQILDGKELKDLPKELQLLLIQIPGAVTAQPQQNTEGTDLLKQLIKFFMPSKGETSSQQTANTPENATGMNKGNVPEQSNASETPKQSSSASNEQTAQQGGAKESAKGTETPSAPQQNPGAKGEQGAVKEQLVLQNQQQTAGEKQAGAKQAPTTQQTPDQIQQASKNQNVLLQNPKEFVALMKNVSQQMLKTSLFSKENAEILQKFINGDSKLLGEKEIRTLQTLLNVTESNIPYSLRQAAARQNLPELPKLWAFVQLSNLTKLLDLNEEKLRAAGKQVQDFATILKKSLQNENEVTPNQRSIFFMTPLYLGENERSYPAYIHLYHQKEEEGGGGQEGKEKETWLRICLLTENVGAVEVIFRLYDEQRLDLRLSFSNYQAVEDFDDYLPEMEKAFENLPFLLTDVKVNMIGEK